MTTARLHHVATPANRAYCLHLLRSHDHENYLANLLHPSKPTRLLHVATRAFNVELANIRSSVSNEDLGRLRLSFFRSGLSAILSRAPSPPSSPVLDVLSEVVSDFPTLSFRPLHVLLDARERDLAYPNVLSLPHLQNFAADTQGSLIALHASALADPSDHVADAAREAGMAVGLSVLLRGAPAHAATRLSYMPRDLTSDMRVAQGELLTGRGDAIKIFEVVAACAEAHLNEARAMINGLAGEVKPAFWPLHMAHIYLRRLRKAGFNPFDERLQVSMRTTYTLALQMRLLAARLMRR